MILKSFLSVIIICLVKKCYSYTVDIYCPNSPSISDSCEEIFSNSSILFKTAHPRIVKRIDDIQSKIIFDLSGCDSNFDVDGSVVFYGSVCYISECNNRKYYSLSPVRSLKNCIKSNIYI